MTFNQSRLSLNYELFYFVISFALLHDSSFPNTFR
jgi:hypothetical protein